MSAERIELRYRFRPSWWYVATAAAASLAELVRRGYVLVGVLWAALACFIVVAHLTVRLSAAEDGIRVLNWGRRRRVEWEDVDRFALARPRGGGQLVAIAKRDGGTVHIWASFGNPGGGTSYEERDRLIGRLESMRRRTLGIADSPELVHALEAVKLGDPEPLDQLLAAGKVPPELYTQRLHELADSGEADLYELRARRRREV